MQRFRNFCSSCEFLRCDRGAAVVEFALVAAPFLALLMALFQTVLVFFAERVLDETTEQASRYIMTGQAQQSNMTQSGFANYVCENTFALFNCKNFTINVQSYNSFAAASTTTPTLTFNAKGQVTNVVGFAIADKLFDKNRKPLRHDATLRLYDIDRSKTLDIRPCRSLAQQAKI
jgi:Flp pilus assembly protein TadG